MRISHGTNIKSIDNTNGYGYATERMIASLREVGHSVKTNDPNADVEIWFTDPTKWRWREGEHRQYRIGYFPWESTDLLPGQRAALNKCDEIWTPSPLIAQWFRDLNLKPPVFVYEHGVDSIWSPVERKVSDRMEFLHLGAEAARKGGLMTMRAFRTAFPGKEDVRLTMKMVMPPGMNIPSFGKIRIINERWPVQQVVDLFHDSHVYVYPSAGEGFGLTPLQAMATGMPTITVPDWAPYHRYTSPYLDLKAELGDSWWGGMIHPGKVFHVDFDDLVDKLRWAYNNYDEEAKHAYEQSPDIMLDYDWNMLTKNMFEGLQNRLENSSKYLYR